MLIKYCCPECGDDQVKRKGLFEWNVRSQKWEPYMALDTAQCPACGIETKELVPIEIIIWPSEE